MTASLVFGDVDSQVVVGEKVFDFFSPLGEAPASGIKIFFVTNVVSFGEVFKAVEVEVIDGFALAVAIFVHDGEGGAANILPDTYL